MQKYNVIIQNYGGVWSFLRDGAAFSAFMAGLYVLTIFLYAMMEG